MTPIELWAGCECTVNRVGDRWFDQHVATGHGQRVDDLDRIAGLGVRRVRVGVQWERVAPDGLACPDWRESDAKLRRCRELGMAPIVGLVHHGSGPAHTDLCDDGFVDGLAEFAEAVARRYPWVQLWTPVNEPMTTARFSGLYGHWYPHGRDIATCMRAVVVQAAATARAMRAIRGVVADAQLVQTEDLGSIRGTDELVYQCAYENERRWLAFDLLEGRVDARHPLRDHLQACGIAADVLDGFVAAPCPPDVIGINYYVTSDRFLDHRVDRYPSHTHGGNGRDRYADVEAARVIGILGHRAVLDAAWQRYARPLALTEVHLGCTREEQLRWLAEAWHAAEHARAGGIDVRAVTVWSAFGAVDWHCLVTRSEGVYEPGVFDIRASRPRATAVARLARALVDDAVDEPCLDRPGWWRCARSRVYAGEIGERELAAAVERPVLVVGGGNLVQRVLGRCAARSLAAIAVPRVDLRRAHAIARRRPWAVIAHADSAGDGERLARWCDVLGVPLLVFTGDHVFDGRSPLAYRERDPMRPSCALGQQQAAFERAVGARSSTLVVRTGILLDPFDPDDTLARILDALADATRVRLPGDEIVSVSSVDEVVDAALDLLIDGERGVWHGTHDGYASLYEIVARAARLRGVGTEHLVAGVALHGWGLEYRPGMRALASERMWPMRGLDDALRSYVQRLSGVDRRRGKDSAA